MPSLAFLRNAVLLNLRDGLVLHINAPALRHRGREAAAPVSGTIGPVPGILGTPQRFGVYTYGRGGFAEEHPTPEDALRALSALLRHEREPTALRAALRKLHADEIATDAAERAASIDRLIGEASLRRAGAAARRAGAKHCVGGGSGGFEALEERYRWTGRL